MSKAKIIEVKNLVKRYKKAEKNAVDRISFYVKRGEFYAFLGPNGAGKTTTISILTTTLSKTSGEVKVSGYDVETQASKVRQNIGVIFQNPSLDENLTAEENVRFHATLYGLYPFRPTFNMMPESYQKRVKELASVLEIDKAIHKPIKSYSGGMKRKLEIVRSLMHKPKVLFLDEPTSGLDPVSRKSLWRYLNNVRQNENTTIFLTTHYLEEAEQADHLSIINDGTIVAFGSPFDIKKQLIEQYLIVESARMDKLKKELEDKNIVYEFDGQFKIHLNGKKVHKIIKSIDTPLSSIDIHKPSLEEAYLKIITKDETT